MRARWFEWLDRWGLGRRGRGPLAEDSEPQDPELVRLLERARALPRSREPERDLWQGIENRIAGRTASPSSQSDSQPASRRGRGGVASLFPRPIAALALATSLVGVSVFATLWVAAQPPSDAEVAAIAERLRERDGVADVRESLVAILEARRTELPTETMATLEANLRSIDRAIAEIHLALESNPDHHNLAFLLAEAYRREADLLERLEWWMRVPGEVRS